MKVLFISGKPRSGKDTLAAYIRRHAEDHGRSCIHKSTIDPVNHVLMHLGWDGETKDATYRAAAASLLDFMVTHNVDAAVHPIDIMCRSIVCCCPDIVTIQTRQGYLRKEIISRLTGTANCGIKHFQVYVDRDVKDFDNSGDSLVHTLRDSADFVIDNNFSLEHLNEEARRIVRAIL